MMTRKPKSRKTENERISTEGETMGLDTKKGPVPASKVDPARGNELLMKLLKTPMPVVPDPEPVQDPTGSQTPFISLDPVENMLRDKPGLTRAKGEEEIRDMGF